MRRSAAQTREHVLQVAHELFFWHGVRAIGVDRVAAEAGVAPVTLYRLFPSKDDLVAAYVERADLDYREWFAEVTAADGRHPRERILAVFAGLPGQLPEKGCRGCAFVMTLTEFPDPGLPAHQHAITAKSWVRGQLLALTEELAGVEPVADPAALADQLMVVLDGATTTAQPFGREGPARQALALAELVLSAGTAAAATAREPVPSVSATER
jgi:AcrR family transcriptional regulator